MEVKSQTQQIETYEMVGDIKKYKTSAKTIKGIVLGLIQKFRNDAKKGKIYSPTELEWVFSESLRRFNEYYPNKIVKNEITILDGWKGKDVKEVYKGFDKDFTIIQHVKDKETGEITEFPHTVKKEDFNRILFIIKKLPLNEPVSCYLIAKKLGYGEWKNLWKERKEYFKFYYFPIKVCEALKIINYSGKGTIIRKV